MPVDYQRYPKTARTYTCTVSVYRGTSKLTATTASSLTDGQFKVVTPSSQNGITVSQSTAGTLSLAVKTASALADITTLSLNVQIYGGITLPANITVTANMNDVAAGAYEVTSNIDSRIEKYITDNSGEIADILKGDFVTVNMLDGYAKTTEVSALITRSINSQGASLTLSTSKGVTERTATSEVIGTYFEDWDFIPGKDEGYGFGFHWDGSWYTSQNAGVNNSYSIGQITFNFSSETLIALQYVYSAEEWGDYGIIGQLDWGLNCDINLDVDGVLMALYEEPSTTVKEIFMKIPAGKHFICFKYIKDDNYFSGNDSFKIRAVRAVETTVSEEGASLTLMNGSAILSATDITFEGYVTFKSLSEPGSTVINGANIMTGTLSADVVDTSQLKVQEVWYNDPTAGYFSVMSSEISGQSTVTRVGPKSIRNGYLQALELYGSSIYFIRAGSQANANSSLMFDMNNTKIIPANALGWNIGTENNSFRDLYIRRIYMWDSNQEKWTMLRAHNKTLRFEDIYGDEYNVALE